MCFLQEYGTAKYISSMITQRIQTKTQIIKRTNKRERTE